MKKLLLRISALLLVAVFTVLPAAALETGEATGCVDSFYAASTAGSNSGSYNAILAALRNKQEIVNVSSHGLSVDDIGAVINSVYKDNPELFYVNDTYRYSYMGTMVSSILFTYKYTGDALDNAVREYNEYLDSAVSAAPAGLDDFGKALYIHDYLASHFEYDTNYAIYDAYNFFKNGSGVCQAYSAAFMAMADRMGLQSSWASSDSGNHMWNVVQINGKWYHIDVTHDDPISDRFGLSQHTRFLMSDSYYGAVYNDIECAFDCTDTSYDDLGWKEISSPIVYTSGKWYAFHGGDLCTVDFSDGSVTPVVELNADWKVWDKPEYYYIDSFSGLCVIDGIIYFNTPTEIKSYDPVTEKTETVLAPDTSNGLIYGINNTGNMLTYSIATSPDNMGENLYHTEIKAFVYGDVNRDGKVNNIDIILLKRCILHKVTLLPEGIKAADVNHDGRINNIDFILVKRAIIFKFTLV